MNDVEIAAATYRFMSLLEKTPKDMTVVATGLEGLLKLWCTRTLEDAKAAVEAERLTGDTLTPEDEAYNQAIGDGVHAIERLASDHHRQCYIFEGQLCSCGGGK
jgi:hypothetical protein